MIKKLEGYNWKNRTNENKTNTKKEEQKKQAHKASYLVNKTKVSERRKGDLSFSKIYKKRRKSKKKKTTIKSYENDAYHAKINIWRQMNNFGVKNSLTENDKDTPNVTQLTGVCFKTLSDTCTLPGTYR